MAGNDCGRSGPPNGINENELPASTSQDFASTPVAQAAYPLHQTPQGYTQYCPQPPLPSERQAMPVSPGFPSSTDPVECDYPSTGSIQGESMQPGPSTHSGEPVLNMQAEDPENELMTYLLKRASAGLKIKPELGTQAVTRFINTMIAKPRVRYKLFAEASQQVRTEFLNLYGIYGAFESLDLGPLEVPTEPFKAHNACYQDDEWGEASTDYFSSTPGPSNTAVPSGYGFATPPNQSGRDPNLAPAAPRIGATGLAYYSPGVSYQPYQQQPQMPRNRGLRLRPRTPNVDPTTPSMDSTLPQSRATTEEPEDEAGRSWFTSILSERLRGVRPIPGSHGTYYLPSRAAPGVNRSECDIFEIRVPEVSIEGMGEEGESLAVSPQVRLPCPPVDISLTSTPGTQHPPEPNPDPPSGPSC